MASRKITTPTADGYVQFNDSVVVNSSFLSHSINSEGDALEGNGNLTERDNPSRMEAHAEVELTPVTSDLLNDSPEHWEMNFHEAAIFLEEGENNEKFDSHPHHPDALPAYLLVHNSWYYSLGLVTSLILMFLAVTEDPAVPAFQLPVGVHGTIELFALAVVGIEVSLKLRWIGWSTILKHKRTMIKCATLGIMCIEAIIVLIRQSSHFRATRALRPIFLVDTRHLGGVRRFIRQILQSMPPIFDMLLLIFFFVSIYAILGFFLFSDNPLDSHFTTLFDSFVSMFVLLTTANFPDIMMPSYSRSKWNSLFFISYLCIVLYVLMNLMLAVVYETFTSIEKRKFRKLLLHKRKAAQQAFRLLVTKQHPNQIRFKQFEGLMRYFSPKKSARDVILMYKYLNTSRTGVLTMDEFYNVYDAVLLNWEAQYSNIPWYHSAWMPLQSLCQLCLNVVRWNYFEHIVYVLILMNGLAMVSRLVNQYTSLEEAAHFFCASWDTLLFYGLFALEVMMKILGLGVAQFFESGWNCYDFTVIIATLFGVVIINSYPSFIYVVVFRPLRLLRLFKVKKRYRDIIGTLALLSPLVKSAAIVMLVLYYFFAIIGMELFAGYDMRNCCNGTAVEDFYKYSENGTSALGYYYLNTFPNLAVSMITLFELTVVNNWFIVMNGYASVVHPATRIYFILFYLTTMVVLTIVVASVLEAFRFRIQYKRQTTKRDEEKLLHEEVDLKWEEVQAWVFDFQLLEKLRSDLIVGGTATYVGCRPRNREVLQRKMYQSEVESWMREAASADKL